MQGSIWVNDVNIPERESLGKNIEAEVAVIGAGMAGVLTAYRLQKAGKNVVVLESARIASGQTKNTTAKITAQHGCLYSALRNNFGQDAASEYAKANLRAVKYFGDIISENQIDCDFITQNSYIYTEKDPERLMRENEACRELGLDTDFTRETALPFSVEGAVVMRNQAQFSPLKFISAISENLNIYEKTPVKEVKDKILYCEGGVVKAEHVVFACHYPFVNFPGLYFLRQHQERSYVIALQNTPPIEGMYIGVDREGGYSFRQSGDTLLLGGGKHRTGENSRGGKYALLRSAAERFFEDSHEIAHWSAQDCITADGIPYIGRFSLARPYWYMATGFGKWGMTASAVAAEIITDQICGRENGCEHVFSPSRFSVKALKGIAGEGVQAVKGLICRNLIIPRARLEEIPVGNGGIIKLNGERVGVYRETEDKYYCVSVRCPHLGCRLEWNPDEKSWDCPCHGSRFDYSGRLLDNPAQRNLSKRKQYSKKRDI